MSCFASTTQEDIYEALECPICESVYMESLWSLFSHVAQSHCTIPLAALSFETLEKMKKSVPKSRVSIIRPAFSENGEPGEYLAALMPPHSLKVTSALSAEIAESGAKSVVEQQMRKQQSAFAKEAVGGGESSSPPEMLVEIKYICMQCGEQIGDSSAVAEHKAKHHGTSPAEENAINTLVALSSNIENVKTVTEPMNPIATSTSPSPHKEEAELPSVRVRKPAQSRPRKPVLGGHVKNANLKCTYCGLMFQNKCKLTRHLMDHKLARNPYRCPYKDCLQSYEAKNKFKTHLLRQHRDLSAAEFTRLLDEGDKEADKLKKLEQRVMKQNGDVHHAQSSYVQLALEQMIKENTNWIIPHNRKDAEEMDLSTSSE